jgi:3-phosphoshikimate 1-carboxyvinyltransferase
MLARLGVSIVRAISAAGRPELRLAAAAELAPFELDVPGDISSAAFLAAFALLSATRPLRIRDVGLNPTRTGFIDVVRRMGGHITIENERESCGEPLGDMVVERSQLRATRITEDEMPALVDEVPVLAILAARAEGTTVIDGAGELRVKESDRISTMVEGLCAVGVRADELEAGLEVQGTDGPLAGRVAAHGDHRIAMSFGVLGRATGGGVVVDDERPAAVSFPGFWSELMRLEQGWR